MNTRSTLLLVAIACAALLTGCFDTRGPRRPIDSGPRDRDDGGIVLMECGDGACAATESCSSCPGDCGSCSGGCGDGTCAATESCSSCPGDCGTCSGGCGDGVCAATESCSTCSLDCGPCPSCGDGTCAATESCSSCPGDCGSCTGSCRSYPVTPYPGVACSSTTATCTDSCADSTCLQSCLMGDSNPDCWLCANQNILACINSAGCQEEWDCYNTCLEDAGCTTSTCPACDPEASDFDACTDTAGSSCGTEWVNCLP